MLSKSQIRFVSSLQQKKFRKQHGAFVVEGAKSVTEFIHSDYQVEQVFMATGTRTKMGKIPQNIKLIETDEAGLKKLSGLKTPQGVLAVVKIPESAPDPVAAGGFTLALDDVQDPGNLGTIIRTADWFGIHHVICSRGSVDAYNPKTVQASMGSLARLRVSYVDLPQLLQETDLPIYGAVLDGVSIYETTFGAEGLIVLGNEGSGISEGVRRFIRYPVTIPRVGRAESLNVAISAALFCSEISRVRPGGE